MAVYPTTLVRNPSEPDRAAAVRRVRSEVTPWYPGDVIATDGFRVVGNISIGFIGEEKDTLPASLTEGFEAQPYENVR